ncbi:MAG: zinc ribbon domain-containing protein [Bacilli bacterium]|nr:zinc ribbon domain-containing protein [Bacilli bacterium]
MNCSKCGSKLEPNDSFCTYCGNKVKTINKNNTLSDEKVELLNTVEPNKVVLMSNDNNKEINTNKKRDVIPILFGLLSLIPFLIPFSIIGIILSNSYKKKYNDNTVGLVISITSLILQIILIICVIIFKPYENITINKEPPKIIEDSYVDNDSTNYQLLGNDNFGYLIASKDWTLYETTTNTDVLQYRYLNTTAIISIYAIKNPTYTLTDYASSINSRMQNYETDNISIEYVNIGKYQAIKQQAYLKKLTSYMTTWCFIDEIGTIHYIALNGTTNPTEHINIINTFKLNR